MLDRLPISNDFCRMCRGEGGDLGCDCEGTGWQSPPPATAHKPQGSLEDELITALRNFHAAQESLTKAIRIANTFRAGMQMRMTQSGQTEEEHAALIELRELEDAQ
jgi:hypothetical protein